VYVSGQLPIDPVTGELDGDTAAQQAEQSISNVEAILAAAELTLAEVVKTTVLVADIADFAAVNEVYARRFSGAVLPARSAFQVAALQKGAKVEIEVIARFRPE
jgi:2-iminobutanoate/2-iminopropanoate deaminase